MYFSVFFLMLCMLYTDVIRLVLGEEYIRFPHEVYVQVPNEGTLLDEGIAPPQEYTDPAVLEKGSAFTTKAKGSLVSSMFVLTVDIFESEQHIQIVSIINADEPSVHACPAMFHFRSKKSHFDILVISGTCKLSKKKIVTPDTYLVRIPKSDWKAEAKSQAAVSYKEAGTSKQYHWSKNVTIEKVSTTQYIMSAESKAILSELFPGSSLVRDGHMIGLLSMDLNCAIINYDAIKEYINALLSEQDEP